MLNLYFWKTDNGYRVYNQLTHEYFGTIRSIEELDRFIDRDLDGYITHQSYDGETLYGWIPRKSYKSFRTWYQAPKNLDMRIIPVDNFRQSNALRIEVIPPETRCMAQPRDKHTRALMERKDGWYHAQYLWSRFGYCIRTQCALCPVYHEIMSGEIDNRKSP